MSFFKKKLEVGSNLDPSVPRPLSRREMHIASRKRISLITKEFADAFKFLESYPKSVTFFGSSRMKTDSEYYAKALSLSKRIVKELGYSVVTGGGPGIMEAANRGAAEAGGSSVGITIKLPKEQKNNTYLTDHIPLYYFFTRKVSLSFSAEAYIFFPGGFGTLDELFELLTLVQTRKIFFVPIILVGSDYWNSFREFILKEVLARDMIDKKDLSIFTIEDDENKIMEIIRGVPVRNGAAYDATIHNIEKHG